MNSVVTSVGSTDRFIALSTSNERTLSIFLYLIFNPFYETIYSTTQLDMLLCGSGRIRTYSARRQQIYSLSRLSNCGADPNAPTTLFYNHPRESDNPYNTTEKVWHLYLVRLCYNPLRKVKDSNLRPSD